MDEAKNAREHAHACLQLADNLTETATKVLRSLRRGNDDWQEHMNLLEVWVALIAEAQPQSEEDAEAIEEQ